MSHEYTAQDITWATRRLDIAMSRLTVALSRKVGISVPEMLALEYLDADGSIGPSELARRLRMTSGAMTALVDRLEDSGHVSRERHPADRRRVLVTRTKKADADIAAETAPMAIEVLDLAESLDGAERQAVGRFFDGFIAIVENTAAEASVMTRSHTRPDLAVTADGDHD
ncbi:MAG: MarR family transcriptional regulator [Actinobacteria bacterium]|nr:MarR family transcriptional regulator [Actinomycetota bacterium]